ncbi:MAG: fibronectin type III domain-containing protein [Pyrinomonadaceae bacterium]|nr:fibronectin type III domain-containing protein [Pyrinomonadaceae bacterium]
MRSQLQDSFQRFFSSKLLPLCVFAVVVSILPFAACGKRRPPQPPVERVQQRTEALTGAQRGNRITLSWPAPSRNAPDSSVQSIRRIDVYRLAERIDAPLPLTEEEFAERATVIGSVDYETISRASGALTYTDTLQLTGQPARLRYAVRYVNAASQRASFSNFLLIEPAVSIAQPPFGVTARESETANNISWQPPAANIDGSTPLNLLGYNLYRISPGQSEAEATLLNSSLISETTFADKNFRFGEAYRYFVRAVSLGTGGQQVESIDSNTVAVTPVDVYPPTPPAAITIAAAPSRLSIFFPANPERDVAGYNIYRSLDPNTPKERWTKLNSEPLTRTTFQDDNVETNQKYYYYLTAVDTAGNTSAPSEVISETVP